MESVAFTGGLSQLETAAILADHVALQQARGFRRRLTPQCGAVALVALSCGYAFPQVASAVRWTSAPLCLLPPLWAWVSERRIARRLSRRLSEGFAQKVIKRP